MNAFIGLCRSYFEQIANASGYRRDPYLCRIVRLSPCSCIRLLLVSESASTPFREPFKTYFQRSFRLLANVYWSQVFIFFATAFDASLASSHSRVSQREHCPFIAMDFHAFSNRQRCNSKYTSWDPFGAIGCTVSVCVDEDLWSWSGERYALSSSVSQEADRSRSCGFRVCSWDVISSRSRR